jgi:hypothetical protein
MPENRSRSHIGPVRRLRSVTVRVPEIYAESLRLFADELRNGPQHDPASLQKWTRVTPSAEMIVDPECRARGIIRDTGAAGIDRFCWSVIPPGQSHPVAEGRAADLTRARAVAEAALRTYADDWRELFPTRQEDG